MKVDVQTDFSGGMCDPRRGMPAESYALAENVRIDAGGLLARRPLATFTEALYEQQNLFWSVVDSAALGPFLFRIWRESGKLYLGGFVYTLANHLEQVLHTKLPTLPYMPGGAYIEEEGIPGAAPGPLQYGSAVQIGQSLYAFLQFRDEYRIYSGAISRFWYLAEVPGIYLYRRGYAAPECRASAYAFGRAWLAARASAETGYFYAAVSDRVDGDAPAPDLVFSEPPLAVDVRTSSDILGFCALGKEMIVFKRRSVWAVTGCDGEVSGMRVRAVSGEAGAVGPHAWTVADGACWFVAGDGLYRIAPGGAAERMTGDVAAFWRENVVFGTDEYPGVTLAVHGDTLLAGVPYGEDAPESGACNAFLAWSLPRRRLAGVWTGDGFGGWLLNYGSRGERPTFALSDAGEVEIHPAHVVSIEGAAHDDLRVTLKTRELAEACGRHFCICVRVGLRNAPDYDGALHGVSVSATVGDKTVTKTLTGACGVLSFMIGRAAESLQVSIVAQGGFATIETVSVGYVPRPA